MTTSTALMDFVVRVKRIDSAKLTCRDILVMWAIQLNPGMMGRELALKLGYPTRSNVQENILKLRTMGLIEDRRLVADNKTPNDLHILQAGEDLLAQIVPS